MKHTLGKTTICSHPEAIPTRWNEPKPEPYAVPTCDCGLNWSCPVCGFGQSSWPCMCDKAALAQEKP